MTEINSTQFGDVRRDTADVVRRARLAGAVIRELERQDERWGEQNHPDGTGPHVLNEDEAEWTYLVLADEQKAWNATLVRNDKLDWRNILLEEVYEAFAESDPERLREELVQVAAVAMQWVGAIDRRTA